MATWSQVRGFLRSGFKLQKDEEDLMTTVLPIGERSQMVVFRKIEEKGDTWLEISSPVGVIPEDKLNEALEFISYARCGGLMKNGENHFVRHTVPIGDLSADEVSGPIVTICVVADMLENKYVGGDSM